LRIHGHDDFSEEKVAEGVEDTWSAGNIWFRSIPIGLCCFTGSNLMRRNVTWMAKDLVLHSISAAFCLICCRHMLTLEYVILGAPDVE